MKATIFILLSLALFACVSEPEQRLKTTIEVSLLSVIDSNPDRVVLLVRDAETQELLLEKSQTIDENMEGVRFTFDTKERDVIIEIQVFSGGEKLAQLKDLALAKEDEGEIQGGLEVAEIATSSESTSGKSSSSEREEGLLSSRLEEVVEIPEGLRGGWSSEECFPIPDANGYATYVWNFAEGKLQQTRTGYWDVLCTEPKPALDEILEAPVDIQILDGELGQKKFSIAIQTESPCLFEAYLEVNLGLGFPDELSLSSAPGSCPETVNAEEPFMYFFERTALL